MRLFFENGVLSAYFDDEEGAILYTSDEGTPFTNQVGGYNCHHPIAKIWDIEPVSIQKNLQDHFTGPIYGGWCGPNEFKMESKAFIESQLEGFMLTENFENQEAWIHGIYNARKCIITWNNSD